MLEINTDILIVGGGSAGVAAAVSAAQSGNKVTLIERLNYLGGKATAAEVGTICGLYKFSKSEKTEYIVNGFAKDFADELSKLSKTQPLHNEAGLHYLPYSIEAYKKLCLQLMQENKVDILFNSEVIKVITSDKLIKSITVKTEEKEFQINCKSIVDCSGDSCISRLADLPLITSDSYQAAAQVFTIQGLTEITEETLNFVLMKELQKAVYNKSLENYFERISVVQGSVKNNMASFKLGIPVDVTFKDNNLEVLRETALEIIHAFVNYFKDHVSIFKNSSLQSIAPEVGIRVGVRPVGNYILTEEDVLNCKKFELAIANGAWPIEEWGQNKRVKMQYFNFDNFYQIPADCLKSINISNLFFAGRNISATDGAIASARVMGICLQTGFAAGALAADQLSHISETETIRAIQMKQIFV